MLLGITNVWIKKSTEVPLLERFPLINFLKGTAEKAQRRAVGLLRGHGFSAEEFAEDMKVVVWSRDDMDGDDFADGAGGGGPGFDGGFDGGDVTLDEDGDVS